MSKAAKIAYPKAWLSHTDQVELLEDRGLVIPDKAAAEEFLAHLNYYRFSGYCLAFEIKRHEFVAGTTFAEVVAAYQFDLTLRDLLTEALEVIEVDLRATVAYRFGEKYGPFGHVDPANFFAEFDHAGWLERVRDEAERSSEQFVVHYERKYLEFPDLPIWVATEVMSFGCLSTMVRWMLRDDQRMIANRYGLQVRVLIKATHHLTYIRNLCAHHSRMWDRVWAIKPELPAGKAWQPPLLPGNNRLFSTLLLMRQLLKQMDGVQQFSDEWRDRVTAHLTQPPPAANALAKMGLTADWDQHPVWI